MATLIDAARLESEPLVLTYAPVPTTAPAGEVSAERPDGEEAQAAAELRKQAFEDGYSDGLKHGVAEGRREAAEAAERLLQVAASIGEALRRGIDEQEDVLVEIAFAAACKVIGQIAATEAGVRGMVREAMRGIPAKHAVVLRISPQDFTLLAAHEHALRDLAQEHAVEVLADERVVMGGCLIETAAGALDARLEVQLRQLAGVLASTRATRIE